MELLTTNQSLGLEYTVTAADSARCLQLDSQDEFPDVLATSRMVGLMEITAARLMRCLLQPGQLSVGVSVDMQHLAPTPLAATIYAKAVYLGLEGRMYRFRIEVHDAGGCVGSGTHTRAIVCPADLLARASRRVAGSGEGT